MYTLKLKIKQLQDTADFSIKILGIASENLFSKQGSLFGQEQSEQNLYSSI